MSQSIRLSRDASTLVTSNNYYISVKNPIAQQYYGKKCILINKEAGCSYSGILRKSDTFPTHFAPMPTFDPTENVDEAKEGKEHLAITAEILKHAEALETQRELTSRVVDMLVTKPAPEETLKKEHQTPLRLRVKFLPWWEGGLALEVDPAKPGTSSISLFNRFGLKLKHLKTL